MSSPLDNIPLDPVKASFDDRPYTALRAYVLFLQGLFRSRPDGMCRWHEDPKKTEIVIVGATPINVDNNEQRPLIVVEMGEGGWSQLSQRGVAEESLANQNRTHADLFATHVIIHCLGRNVETASSISWWVIRHIPLFYGDLLKFGKIHTISLNLRRGKPSDPGAIVRGSTYPEIIDVPIVSPFTLSVTTVVTQQEDSNFQSTARHITMSMERGLGSLDAPRERGSRVEGPAVDVSRVRPNGDFTLRPPTLHGKVLRRVDSLDTVPSGRARTETTTTSLDP